MADYYVYYHSDSSITSVQEFLDEPTSIARSFASTPDVFLDYANENGVRNRDTLFIYFYARIGESFLESYPTAEAITSDISIFTGITFFIPKDKANSELMAIVGDNVFLKQADVNIFMSESISKLMKDPLYVKSNILIGKGGAGKISMINQFLQVWIYIKSIDKIVNVTPFVRNINTSVSEIGSFSLSLASINEIENVFKLENQYISISQSNNDSKYITPYFHKFIQQNDVIFISFEKLNKEQDRDLQPYIHKGHLPDQIFDMIGLVDTCSMSYTAMSNDSSISISGRDFNKVLLEDGAYFLPFALMSNSDDFFLNTNQNDRFFKRLFVKEYQGIWFNQAKTIRECIGFIFNQLSNTGFLPKDTKLFNAYPDDKISKTYSVLNGNQEYLESIEQNGVWKIIKLEVDKSLDDRRVVNGDISMPDGTLMSELKKICQDPFVEFWGDTYGDTFTFIARQAPFSKSLIFDYLLNYTPILVESKDISSFSLNWETEYYSWFQLLPQNGLSGIKDFLAGAIVPIVYLQEYVDVFGNHRRSIPCNYQSFKALVGNDRKGDVDTFKRANAEDMKYVIDSSSYLPFTRKGSIVIKGGDRRIKRGMFIDLEATGEMFYVNGVTNTLRTSSSDIDRETILDVSRGMVKDYIVGREVNNKKISYFNIVNVDLIYNQIISLVSGKQGVNNTTKSSNVIDPIVFDFFLKRKQFERLGTTLEIKGGVDVIANI